ncbi:O-methyltransferase [Penicillium desertorum]|uniref:O-methyltransferase n=1 Tax=Penicillium desertorum TaxID=1303715 RepID=A0A9X0BG57_9EURO|nr:O-methyltransferase [Penicillium desertorum]
MERFPPTVNDVVKLTQLGSLLSESIKVVTDEWSREQYDTSQTSGVDNARFLPSKRLHQAQRTILAVSGALNEMVIEPFNRLQEVAAQFWESRALGVTVERRIPDILHEAGNAGMDVQILAQRTGIEPHKLCTDRFANNRITAPLVGNEEFRAYILIFHMDVYSASERFPKSLLGPKGASYDVAETALQEALGTPKSRWDWLSERVRPDQITNDGVGYSGVADPQNWTHLQPDSDGLIKRPELDNFGLAMVGGGKVSGAALPFDYPWDELPKGATVVDVGGGVGGFDLQLLTSYPHFTCVVQDRAEVIRQAEETFWPQNGQHLVQSGSVTFQTHDFFQPNPVKNADVYWLRAILHDWSDEYCVQILVALKDSLSDTSRVLICDQVMNTTHGSDEMDNAPSPLPANYGYYSRYHHQRDMSLMGTINGIERTPQQFRELVEKAGLRLSRVFETRSIYSIVEVQK